MGSAEGKREATKRAVQGNKTLGAREERGERIEV